MTFPDPAGRPHDETDWLAVRYLLDELTPDEAAAFEARLAEDQSAREALARATVLVQALGEAGQPVRTVAPSRRAVRKIAALLAMVAAAVLVGVFVSRGVNTESAKPPRLAADEVDPARLVVLWADAEEPAGDVTPAEPSDNGAADSDPLLPPDWMLAAVEQETADGAAPSLDPSTDDIELN
jgi:hypothetical protein